MEEYTWYIDENGIISNTEFIEMPEKYMSKPYPMALWRIEPTINNGFPFNELMPDMVPTGAFMNAVNLQTVYIPRTCKKIGAFSFRNTALKKVYIAADCEYSSTSFPDDCEVMFYGGGGDYGQVYDSEDYACIDADGALCYIKE